MSDNGGSVGQSSATGVALAVFALSWKSRSGADFETETHTWFEIDHHVGAMRIRNTKIKCYLKTTSKQAMNAFIEKENIKLEPQVTTPFVTEEKLAWKQEQQRTFGKALLSNLPL